jgi:3-isopropylmalate dehydrogenase
VDKANVFGSMAFFRQVFMERARAFPQVAADAAYVDATALNLVLQPWTFDVMVTENMFGDILSDLAAGLVGGMGMAPSADIGENYAVFQPAHGSAPDIAGKGVANPVATILSVAMMFEWFAEMDMNADVSRSGAEMIRTAVRTVLADPAARTRDMGYGLKTHLNTQQMTRLIISALPAL